jgi:hypothetical protein
VIAANLSYHNSYTMSHIILRNDTVSKDGQVEIITSQRLINACLGKYELRKSTINSSFLNNVNIRDISGIQSDFLLV